MSRDAYSPMGKKLSSLRERLQRKGRLKTRILSDSKIHTAGLPRRCEAALQTGVVQTLFGTQEGLKILGVEKYNVLEEAPTPREFNPLDNPFAPESNPYSPRYNSHEWYQYKANPLDVKWATPPHCRD